MSFLSSTTYTSALEDHRKLILHVTKPSVTLLSPFPSLLLFFSTTLSYSHRTPTLLFFFPYVLSLLHFGYLSINTCSLPSPIYLPIPSGRLRDPLLCCRHLKNPTYLLYPPRSFNWNLPTDHHFTQVSSYG
ncbi:hypothetical protein P9112_010368 [Eukaryota sp. TZLM1-RC]